MSKHDSDIAVPGGLMVAFLAVVCVSIASFVAVAHLNQDPNETIAAHLHEGD